MTEKSQYQLNIEQAVKGKDEEELNKAKVKDSRHSTIRMSRLNSPDVELYVNGNSNNNKNNENLKPENHHLNNLESLPLNDSNYFDVNQKMLYENNIEIRVNKLNNNKTLLSTSTSSSSSSSTSYSSCSDNKNSFNSRHSSSVEISRTTKTNDDGLPIISFHFYQTNENLNHNNNHCIDKATISTDIYNFSDKCQKNKVITHVSLPEVLENSNTQTEQQQFSSLLVNNKNSNKNNQKMDLYDVPYSSIYDVPKPRNLYINQINQQVSPSSSSSSPSRIVTPDANKTTGIINGTSEGDANDSEEIFYETLECRMEKNNDVNSLNEGSYLKCYNNVDEEKKKSDIELSTSSECNNNNNIKDEEKEKEKEKKVQKHRVEKAWSKMRKWIRDEKIKISEVVNKHAMMQAVGATSIHNSEINSNSTLSGSRCGFYDLVDAEEREFGLKKCDGKKLKSTTDLSVSKELNNSNDSHDLKTHKSLEFLPVNNHNGNDDDDVGDDELKVEKVVGKKKSQEVKGTLRKKIASMENILSGTKMKLTAVSISLDKLSDTKESEKVQKNVNNSGGGSGTGGGGGSTSNYGDDDKELKSYIGKGTIFRRRMMGSIRGIMATAHLHQPENEETGPGGFEDVRRYVKQGGDFCKELAAILHERAELEASYAKGLSKLSTKLTKACSKDQGGNGSGGVNEAWRNVGEEMEAAAEAHRVWGIALEEQIAKPLRVGVTEAQGRSRKSIESSVDKASKSLQEWRTIAAKSKKQSFSCARENERLQDIARIQSISQSQQNNNKTSNNHHMTEKEVNKLENRRRKAEDSSRRADTEFYTVSVRAERARLEYESTVRKGARQMELLEEERLSALKDLANVYLAHLQAFAPRLQQIADRLATPVRNCSVSQDIDIIKNLIRRMDSNDAANVDQLLPDFYAEHVTLAMNRERRKQALVRALHLIRQDLERERRGREGLETLHRAFLQTPAFAADESTQNVTEKLHHMRSMLTYLEAAKYKVGGALAEIEGGKRGKHPLAEHILVSRDKQGLQQSVLKIPSWAKNESFEFPDIDDDIDIHLTKDNERHDWIDRGAGDGNSENHPDEDDFSDFDEFSSQSEDNNNQDVDVNDINEIKTEGIEQCRAIYQYSANLTDELNLTPGDLITIHRKQADGWWIGECDGRTGIFPATYVQVIH